MSQSTMNMNRWRGDDETFIANRGHTDLYREGPA
jgi:hypothetical protein